MYSRSKISHDPQNTTWANNTTRFGHRILTTQGWKPGSTLGAKDASHSAHYTAASNSHIRVLLKEDNLGLGAKRGSERAENFGLAALESVLGRLNGKEAEVKKEEERRDEIERRGWVARKYGFMNFVSGGFLVGDKIEKGLKVEVKDEEKDVKIKVEATDEGLEVEMIEKKSKKRKRSKDASEGDEFKEEAEDEQRRLKRKKKSMNLRETAEVDAVSKNRAVSKDKKDKKKSKRETSLQSDSADPPSLQKSSAPGSQEPLSDKARRKEEKRARKEEKKLKKALKKAAKEAARSNPSVNEPIAESSSSEDEETGTPSSSSVPRTGSSTPVGLVFGAGGRHAVRQRYIRQKKMASMDPQALKEVIYLYVPLACRVLLTRADFHDKDPLLIKSTSDFGFIKHKRGVGIAFSAAYLSI